MILDIDSIPFADIKPNSLLVVRLPPGARPNGESIEQMASALRRYIPDSVQILITQPNTEVLSIDEETLNAAGWYKLPAPPPPNAPSQEVR